MEQSQNLLDRIPGYREAIDRESEDRDLDFLNVERLLCGRPVVSITPERFIVLDGVGSPFVRPRRFISVEDVCLFLWLLHPKYSTEPSFKRTFWKTVHALKCRKIIYPDCLDQIQEFVRWTFEDGPAGSGVHAFSPSFTSWMADIVGQIAREYGWSEEAILKTPFRKIFQYLREIHHHHDPKKTFFNPSDKVRGKWLDEMNRGKN